MYKQVKLKITIKIIDLEIIKNLRQTLGGNGCMHVFI